MDPKIDPKAYVEPEYYSMVSESDAQYDSEEELKKLIEKHTQSNEWLQLKDWNFWRRHNCGIS